MCFSSRPAFALFPSTPIERGGILYICVTLHPFHKLLLSQMTSFFAHEQRTIRGKIQFFPYAINNINFLEFQSRSFYAVLDLLVI